MLKPATSATERVARIFGAVLLALFILLSLPALAADASVRSLWASFWAWCLGNPLAAVGFVVYVLLNLINKLSAYPRAAGIVSGLKVVCDLVSVLPHRDSPSYFTLPGQRSTPPPDHPDAQGAPQP